MIIIKLIITDSPLIQQLLKISFIFWWNYCRFKTIITFSAHCSLISMEKTIIPHCTTLASQVSTWSNSIWNHYSLQHSSKQICHRPIYHYRWAPEEKSLCKNLHHYWNLQKKSRIWGFQADYSAGFELYEGRPFSGTLRPDWILYQAKSLLLQGFRLSVWLSAIEFIRSRSAGKRLQYCIKTFKTGPESHSRWCSFQNKEKIHGEIKRRHLNLFL